MTSTTPGQKPPATPTEIGASVVEAIRPTIEEEAKKNDVRAVHIVIRNTSLPHDCGGMYNGCVYRSHNAQESDTERVRAFANGKAHLCNRVNRDSKDAWTFNHLRAGDCYYGGGIWRDHITVSVSGFSEVLDHGFAEEIAKEVMRHYDRLFEWHKEHGDAPGFMGNYVPVPAAPFEG